MICLIWEELLGTGPLRVVERAEIRFEDGTRRMAYVAGRDEFSIIYDTSAVDRDDKQFIEYGSHGFARIDAITYVPLRPIVE